MHSTGAKSLCCEWYNKTEMLEKGVQIIFRPVIQVNWLMIHDTVHVKGLSILLCKRNIDQGISSH